MNKRKCFRCGNDYGRNDPCDMINHEGAELKEFQDDTWDYHDGRCYGCYLDFLCNIFGGWLEPCFTLNGQEWLAGGRVGDHHAPDGNYEIPF